MKSEDDPEARIRALEQPLADAARSSELSANPPPGKWAPPPGPPMRPPSSMPNDGGFLYPSTAPARQGRTVWILLSLFVIGVIALPIGIFLVSSHQVSRGGLNTPLPTPSSSPLSPSHAGPSSSGVAIPTPPNASSMVPTGQNVTVSGINEVRTVACSGGSVSVSGITNNVTITGHCTNVIVSGIQNHVTVDTSDSIQASGSENQVTYHSGSPKTSKSGLGNVVRKG